MYVAVLCELAAKAVDQSFIYHVPNELTDRIKVGIRVKIPFGKRQIEGFVLDITDNILLDKEKVKSIISIIDDEPVLNEEMLILGKYMADNLLCSRVAAYQVMLPKALKAQANTNIKIKYNRYLRRNTSTQEIDNYISKCKYDAQIKILCSLKENDIPIKKMNSSINTILRHNLALIVYEEETRYKYSGKYDYKKVKLTMEQENVSLAIINSLGKANTFLLYGVTGSGKTEIYMDIIEKVLQEDKSAIVLVPEIGLTPQIVGKFISRFGDIISVLHSKLSDSERYDEYRKITLGKSKIAIGTRSAIFSPFSSLGIIIIDEEHTASYKQENNPKYNAKDIAIWRSKYHNCPVLLGSATPSLETMARAANGVYTLLTLTKRAGNSVLPKVEIVDMKREFKKENFILSEILKLKIKDRLAKGEQIILLLNRRGYSSIISCKNCGYVAKCPECDITYTYHKVSNNLKCHYCGTSVPMLYKCPVCGSNDLKDYGLGTEKLEEELKKLYNARIIRMDVDTTTKKGSYQQIIDDFGEYKYDILIGTQMIAKGLDFPRVTLVGVVSLDNSLLIPDFRASENTFQLLSQVAGRAGRSSREGEVVIQTFNPEHYSIKLAERHNYLGFYKEEMRIRKMLKYPPYYYMVLIGISSSDSSLALREADKIVKYLRNNLEHETILLGPAAANIFKVNRTFHYQVIIKYRNDQKLMSCLKFIDKIYQKNNKVNIEIDFNPVRV